MRVPRVLIAVPTSTWVLRLLIVLGPVLALACGALADHPPRAAVLILATVVGVAWARRPDGWFGTAVSLAVVVWWAQALRADVPLAVVPATLALTSAHVAALLADLGPARMGLDPAVRRLWVVRAAGSVAVAAILWGVAGVARGTHPPGLWVLALLGVLVASVATAVALSRSNLEGHGAADDRGHAPVRS